jgi:hypothetical protein
MGATDAARRALSYLISPYRLRLRARERELQQELDDMAQLLTARTNERDRLRAWFGSTAPVPGVPLLAHICCDAWQAGGWERAAEAVARVIMAATPPDSTAEERALRRLGQHLATVGATPLTLVDNDAAANAEEDIRVHGVGIETGRID